MTEEKQRLLTLPNLLSASRVILAPFLLALAWGGEKRLFLILLAVSFLSDAADGYLARRFRQTSVIGTKLDSWGDFANYMSLPFCAWWLWPDVIRQEKWFVLIALASYIVPSVIGAIKFRRMSSYHTYGSKFCAVMFAFSMFFFLTGISPWPFRICAAILVLAAADDSAITFILSRWHPNVHSFRHALQIERKQRLARPRLEDCG